MLQTTQPEVILHSFQYVRSECQVLWHDQAVTSKISVVQNSRKYNVYFYHIMKHLLTVVSVDLMCNSPVSLIKLTFHYCTVKPVLSGHTIRRPKLVFNTDNRLMQVKSISECSKGSILQYFRPSLSYHLSLRSLVCLFLSGRLRQGLL